LCSSLAAAAEAEGYELERSEPIQRRRRFGVAALPAGVVDAGFGLSPHAPLAKEVVADGDRFFVVALERADQGEAMPEDEVRVLRQRLLEEQRNRILNAWLQELERRSDIWINAKILEAD